MNQEIIDLTQKLLDAIASGDWDTYTNLCDPSLTCFEPEAKGHLVHGMGFHKFYFDNKPEGSEEESAPAMNTTISSPHVRIIGESVAVISYVRLIQKMHPQAGAITSKFEETRVWERRDDKWIHVHLHRSRPAGEGFGRGRGGRFARWQKMRKQGRGDCK